MCAVVITVVDLETAAAVFALFIDATGAIVIALLLMPLMLLLRSLLSWLTMVVVVVVGVVAVPDLYA